MAWEIVSIEGDVFYAPGEAAGTLQKLQPGTDLGREAIVVTGEDSRVRFRNNEAGSFILGHLSAFQFKGENSFYLARGSSLWRLGKTDAGWTFSGKQTSAKVDSGSFLVEATSIGGLKFINLIEKLKIASRDKKKSLHSGQVVFVGTEKSPFSRRIDIYLFDLITTSRLVKEFFEDESWKKKLLARAYLQHERTKGISNAFVGDAVSDEKVELFIEK